MGAAGLLLGYTMPLGARLWRMTGRLRAARSLLVVL